MGKSLEVFNVSLHKLWGKSSEKLEPFFEKLEYRFFSWKYYDGKYHMFI